MMATNKSTKRTKPSNGVKPPMTIESGAEGPPSSTDNKADGRPWAEKLMMQEGGHQNFSPMMELSRGSIKPEEYLMRTHFWDQDDQQLFLLEIAQSFRMSRGYSDQGLTLWIDLQSRPSIKSERVHIIEKMFIGERERQKEMVSGILRRSRSMNTGEDTLPQPGKGS